MYLAVTLAAIATGLNQATAYASRFMQSAEAVSGLSLEEAALKSCIEFGAPHAVIVDGTAYCYASFYGSEQVIALEELQEFKAKSAK